MEFKWTKGKVIGITIAVLTLAFFAIANPWSVNDAGERQVVQTMDGKLSVRFEPGFYWSGPFAKVTTYPNNVTIQVGPEKKKSEQADYWENSHKCAFSGGDQASMGHTVKWSLPTTSSKMLALHKEYTNIQNLMTTTLVQYQKETMQYSTARMESEEHYSGGQAQLKSYYDDQLSNGHVITKSRTDIITDTTTGESTNRIVVEPVLDRNGDIKRNKSDIQKFNLRPTFASVDYVDYDNRIDTKLADKIDAAAEESTSKQRLITAQQEEEEAIVRGRKLIAEVKAKEEADEQQEVIRARKEKLVAAENLEKSKLDAKAELVRKKAQAEGDRLKVQAGLTPKERAEYDMKTAIGVARELAKRDVPQFIMGGNGNGQSSLSNAYTMEQMLLMQQKLSKKNN